MWPPAIPTDSLSLWWGVPQPAGTQRAAAEGKVIQCSGVYVKLQMDIFSLHLTMKRYTGLRVTLNIFLYWKITLTFLCLFKIHIDNKLITLHCYIPAPTFLRACICMCVCFSAALSRLSASRSVKRLFFRWSQSWRDSNNWVYKILILLCWSRFLSLSRLWCPSHLPPPPPLSHSLNSLHAKWNTSYITIYTIYTY